MIKKQRASIVKAPRCGQSIIDPTLCHKLTGTHYRLLLCVKDLYTRPFSERIAFRIDLETAIMPYTLAGRQILAARYQLYPATTKSTKDTKGIKKILVILVFFVVTVKQARFAQRRMLER